MQAASETIMQAAEALDDSTQGHSLDGQVQAAGAVASGTQPHETQIAQTSCVQSNRGGVPCERCALRNYINDQVCKVVAIFLVYFVGACLYFKFLNWLFPI